VHPKLFSQQIYAFTPAPPAERLFWAFPRFSVAKLLAQYGQRRNPSKWVSDLMGDCRNGPPLTCTKSSDSVHPVSGGLAGFVACL
jgi:hypothetical protein